MRLYGTSYDRHEPNQSSRAARHGAGNPASKRAERRHAKRRARAEGKAEARNSCGKD